MIIEGKIALVTGGASGIGKALTQRLLEKGIKLVAVLDSDQSNGRKLEREFSETFGHGRVKYIECDVTDENQLKKCFQETFDVHQALDIVVNNAGIISTDHHKTIAVNLVAVMNGMLIGKELMTKTERTETGVILNTSSATALRSFPGANFSYAASKYGVVGLTKYFPNSADQFSKDVRAVAICPGFVATPISLRNHYETEEEEERRRRERPDVYISIDMAVDAFIQAIDDDTLNGAIISVDLDGIRVVH